MSSYLVVGMQKSGTSVVYAMLKAALKTPVCSFEPASVRQIEYLLNANNRNKLAKILYRGFADKIQNLDSFRYKIHIVRDPRDIVVSYLLYWPLLRGRHLQTDFIAEFVDLLERKETDPPSVTLRDFSDLTTKHGARFLRPSDFRALCNSAFQYHCFLKYAYTLKYDCLISGQLESAEEYLGLPLPRSAKVGNHISYNERQKAVGSWRNWFTPLDVADYLPALSAFIEYFDFDVDWTLNETPSIAPEHGSSHIRNSVEKLAKYPAPNGELRDRMFYTDEYFSHLQSARSDGIESAMIELALAHFAGFGVEKSLRQYQSHLWEAYERGNPTAMIHLSMATRLGVIGIENGLTAEKLAREAAAIVGKRTYERRAHRIEHFYATRS